MISYLCRNKNQDRSAFLLRKRRQHIFGQDPQQYQMSRVEPVKEILQGQSTFAVVEVYGEECRRGGQFPGDGRSAAQTLIQPGKAEEIEDLDQKYALVAVVGL